MENGGRLRRGQSSWEILELGNWASAATTFSSAASSSYTAIASSSSCSPFSDHPVGPEIGASRFNGDHQQYPYQQQQTHHHLTCLKLGKRPYYGGGEGVGVGVGVNIGVGGAVVKRERSSAGAGMGVAPRCQVEGCNKALVDAKDYHRRHKVCEMHSKAPKVVVLGAEQRFCQQCSRFHVISEFDDSKRSCRRRLAGHNERRRKSTSDSIMRNPSLESTTMGSRFPYLSPSPGRALSLLSSKASPWISTPDLSSRSSAALHELIAENRATLLARQLFSDRCWHNIVPENQLVLSYVPHQHQVPSHAPTQLADGWNQFQESGSHVTLDLMQTPNSSSFEFLSGRSKSKEEEEECCEIWKSLEGTHVKNARLHCLHRSSTRCM